jgi:hypothetical protein
VTRSGVGRGGYGGYEYKCVYGVQPNMIVTSYNLDVATASSITLSIFTPSELHCGRGGMGVIVRDAGYGYQVVASLLPAYPPPHPPETVVTRLALEKVR